MYQPEVGTQQGENHQVQIEAYVYGSTHQLLEHQAKEVSFFIVPIPKPKEKAEEPTTTKPSKKASSRTSKKGSQPKEKASLPGDRFTQPE